MERAEPASWVNKPYEGYVVNAEFSEENKSVLKNLIDGFGEEFGDAVFSMPINSLHITLFDWIAPLVDYEGKDKKQLFDQIYASYDEALTDILSNMSPINVFFDEIRISPSTVFIVGRDGGEFGAIRDEFVNAVELLPGTKRPPQIIHSSLLRFTAPIGLSEVRTFISKRKLDITQEVNSFRLIHTSREPMLEYEIIKNYALKRV